MTDSRPYRKIASRYLWQSRWYNVRQDQLVAVDGSELTYTVIDKPGAVWIVPVTADGRLILINQYRYAVDDWCLEVPAGNIEPGFGAEDMAVRELREEVGGTAGRLIPITEFYTMNGIGNEVALVYLALDVTVGEAAREPTEHIELHAVPWREGIRLSRTGQIKDGPSALAILLCEPTLQTLLGEQSG